MLYNGTFNESATRYPGRRLHSHSPGPGLCFALKMQESKLRNIFPCPKWLLIFLYMQLCRVIRDLINNTIEIEYKLALARAGKAELGQSCLCIADRLQTLQTLCTTAFPLDALPFIRLSDEVIPHWPGVTDGFIPVLTNNRLDLVLWRPALPVRGAREERRSIPAIMSHLSNSPKVPPAVMGTLAVDIAQDLFVFSRPGRPEMWVAQYRGTII